MLSNTLDGGVPYFDDPQIDDFSSLIDTTAVVLFCCTHLLILIALTSSRDTATLFNHRHNLWQSNDVATHHDILVHVFTSKQAGTLANS